MPITGCWIAGCAAAGGSAARVLKRRWHGFKPERFHCDRQVRLLDRLRKGFLSMPRDHDIMRLFCPTEQTDFRKIRKSLNLQQPSTVHGVVFEISLFGPG
jgi:hypothetical protein